MTVFINSSAQEAGYYDVGVKQKSQFHLSIIQQNVVFYATQECLVLLWKSTLQAYIFFIIVYEIFFQFNGHSF